MADGEDETASKVAAAFVSYWLGQLDAYKEEFEDWQKRADKIVQRYRDDRDEKQDGQDYSPWRFNSLWSNVQTLQPAIYIKPPKPNVERRYLDRDPLARFASMTLERALEVTIQQCGFHSSMQKASLDYLLVGRGVLWDRYEPTYGTPEDLGPTPADDESNTASVAERSDDEGEPDAEGDPAEAPRPVTWEKVYTDYVGYRNFAHSPAPVWEEVTWVGKLEFLSRKELRTRFKGVDPVTQKPIADLIPLQSEADKQRDQRGRYIKGKRRPKAAVWEIWDKTNLEVVFIAPDYPQQALERTPDPLSLQEFWPCAKPLYATTTNDTLVPVPDYIEYQDQARELDNLTARIKALTDAVRVNGVYDASIPELKRILSEGNDNRLIAVAKWAEFSQKGGLEKSVDFIPIKDVVDALIRLYEARDRVKADMAEITGLSDIVRGQGQGAAKTATEQRIKGQFATLRLQDRQGEVARFCRDTIAISAEIIAEQFSPEILSEMTGMIPFIADEIRTSAPPNPMMGHNGGPPMATPAGSPIPPQALGANPGPTQPPGAGALPPMASPPMAPPPPDPNELAKQVFAQAVDLLKNDKMRTFRIDIETNSTIEVDKQAEKEATVELFTAVGGFLEKATMIGQQVPAFVPALGQSILFAFRKFGVGRDIESAWEQAIDKITQQAKNPPPKQPSPEEIKAQAEMAKQQAEDQREAARFQMEQQAAAQESQRQQQQQQADFALKQQEMAMEGERLAREDQFAAVEHARKMELLNRQFELDELKIASQMALTDKQHTMKMEQASEPRNTDKG